MESNKFIYHLMLDLLNKMKENPDSLTDDDKSFLIKIYSGLCKSLKFSEHSAWAVEWAVEKWHSMEEKLSGVAPYEVVSTGQNIILDAGATEMLKLICGTGGTAYNNTNAKMYVGTDTTPENASQTGVIAQSNNRAYANMDGGYPTVDGRTATFRASFGDDSANFAWNEASISNGSGVGSVAMNRKVSTMGTKSGGTWTLQMTISLVSA